MQKLLNSEILQLSFFQENPLSIPLIILTHNQIQNIKNHSTNLYVKILQILLLTPASFIQQEALPQPKYRLLSDACCLYGRSLQHFFLRYKIQQISIDQHHHLSRKITFNQLLSYRIILNQTKEKIQNYLEISRRQINIKIAKSTYAVCLQIK